MVIDCSAHRISSVEKIVSICAIVSKERVGIESEEIHLTSFQSVAILA